MQEKTAPASAQTALQWSVLHISGAPVEAVTLSVEPHEGGMRGRIIDMASGLEFTVWNLNEAPFPDAGTAKLATEDAVADQLLVEHANVTRFLAMLNVSPHRGHRTVKRGAPTLTWNARVSASSGGTTHLAMLGDYQFEVGEWSWGERITLHWKCRDEISHRVDKPDGQPWASVEEAKVAAETLVVEMLRATADHAIALLSEAGDHLFAEDNPEVLAMREASTRKAPLLDGKTEARIAEAVLQASEELHDDDMSIVVARHAVRVFEHTRRGALGDRAAILSEVCDERARQDAKWGGPGHDDGHNFLEWFSYVLTHAARGLGGMVEETSGEVEPSGAPTWVFRTTIPNAQGEAFRRQFVRVAALALAAVESVDRRAQRGQVEVSRRRADGEPVEATPWCERGVQLALGGGVSAQPSAPAAPPDRWCIGRYSVFPDGKPAPFSEEILQQMFCVFPHNLCGVLSPIDPELDLAPSLGERRFNIGKGGIIGRDVVFFATEEEARAALQRQPQLPGAVDVALRVRDLHFYATTYDHYTGERELIYDGGLYEEALAAVDASPDGGRAGLHWSSARRREARIQVRPARPELSLVGRGR